MILKHIFIKENELAMSCDSFVSLFPFIFVYFAYQNVKMSLLIYALIGLPTAKMVKKSSYFTVRL